jgi:TolA-binding protein
VKYYKLFIFFLMVAVLPFILLSNKTLNSFQHYLDRHNEAGWAPKWQLKLADIYRSTLREAAAADAYGKFLKRYPNAPGYPEAKYNRAMCLEETDKDTAMQEYQEFIDWYPEHELKTQAEHKFNRLKYGF